MPQTWIHDRRSNPRHAASEEIQISYRDRNGLLKNQKGTLTNLNEGGAQIEIAPSLPKEVFSLNIKGSFFSSKIPSKIVSKSQNLYNLEFLETSHELQKSIHRTLAELNLPLTIDRRKSEKNRRLAEEGGARQVKPRFALPDEVTVNIQENSGQNYKGQIIDVSENGLCISLENSINLLKGEHKLKIQDSKNTSTEFIAKPCWQKKLDGESLWGLQIAEKNGNTKKFKEFITGITAQSDPKDRRTNSVDRRKQHIFAKDANNGFYTFHKTVYLTDTNAFGNTYFARYFDWQGMVREAYLRVVVPNYLQMFATGIKWITAEAQMIYKHETRVYDEVAISVKPGFMKKSSFELLFTYYNKNTKQLIGNGRQVITFAGPDGKIVKIPKELADGLKPYTKNHKISLSGIALPQPK